MVKGGRKQVCRQPLEVFSWVTVTVHIEKKVVVAEIAVPRSPCSDTLTIDPPGDFNGCMNGTSYSCNNKLILKTH
uniref:Uncharacterized protein n=1 Tax=Ditylenchus dipsaci TaxID=166011 RepID=A0A915DCI6_9BILA